MLAISVPVRFAEPMRSLRLRPISGRDERSVSGTSTRDAIHFVNGVIETGNRFDAADLTACDRDRVLAAIYATLYGDKISSSIRCRQCEELFDISFSISELCSSLDVRSETSSLRSVGEGYFESVEGVRFRLPTGRDELQVAEMDEDAAIRALRAVSLESQSVQMPDVEDLLDEVAPLIDLELLTACPECGGEQSVSFDIQSYLLGSLASERPSLMREIHRLAAVYGWSLDEILSLTRNDRKELVRAIEGESLS